MTNTTNKHNPYQSNSLYTDAGIHINTKDNQVAKSEYVKTCVACPAEFTTQVRTRRYCSIDCIDYDHRFDVPKHIGSF